MSRASALPPPRLAAAAAAALALGLTACGESRKEASSTSTTAASPAAPAGPRGDFAVALREYSIEPSDLDVPKTGSFKLAVRNAGTVAHALEVEGPAGEVRTATIAPGKTATLAVTLDRPGRYEWYCPLDGHRGRGMRGTVVVAGGGPATKAASSSSEDRGRRHGRKGGNKGGASGSGNTTGGAPAPQGDSTYP